MYNCLSNRFGTLNVTPRTPHAHAQMQTHMRTTDAHAKVYTRTRRFAHTGRDIETGRLENTRAVVK